MNTLTRFIPALTGFLIALVNAIDPDIAKFVADHPDVAINGYALLTTLANSIHPTKPSVEAPAIL